MKKALRITVKDKIATYLQRDGVIVCGNKGYKIAFTFDEEWDAYETKIARFIWNDKYYDRTFTGKECDVPVINDATEVTVGVYAGDLKTTTPAVIPCLISILCGNPEVADVMVKEYREEALIAAEEAKAAADEAKTAADEAKSAAGVVIFPVINVTDIADGHRVTIKDVEGTKTFDVMNGKDGKDGEGGEGTLTEEDAALLAKLSKWYDDEHYVKLTGTFSMSPPDTIYEIGATKSIIFSWAFNKLPIEVTFNGASQTAAQTGSKSVTVTSQTNSTLTYTIYGKYREGETFTKSLTINFRNKYYYGCAAAPTNVSGDFVKNLSTSGWANGKSISFTPNCTAGTYVWYAYPKRFGEVILKMGGFQGGFEDPQIVSVRNNSGFAEDYYVYRSINSGIGDLMIEAN